MFKLNNSLIKSYAARLTSAIIVMSLSAAACSCSSEGGGFDGTRFDKTKVISVLSDSSDTELEKFIHDSVLEECNIDIRFVSEDYYVQDYGIVPDVAYSYDANKITTYYKMGSVLNVDPYLDEYGYVLSDLSTIMGEGCSCFDSDSQSEVWYLTPADPAPEAMVTFIRSDWLEQLGLEAPSNRDELYDCLIAFRDNADLLLGDSASELIPFFIDSEPNISCKPLFDSFYDTDISDEEFYENGYCRATQDGYADGLALLNQWYLEDLLPEDFSTIIPGSKESYEPIEKGFVGAFCADSEYLYRNGEDSLLNAFKMNCGDGAGYIAVNTFENADGDYTCWQEDSLETPTRYIYMPSTCSDPLACLVYLNWLSNPDNIDLIKANATVASFAYSYLLTCSEADNADIYTNEDALNAKKTAEEVLYVSRQNKCIKYTPSIFIYVDTAVDIKTLYPDSLKTYSYTAITAPEGCFDEITLEAFAVYVNSGAGVLFKIRTAEWNKVMVEGIMRPW